MKLFIFTLLLLNASVRANPFIEVGVGAPISSCIYQGWVRTVDNVKINCSDSPIGNFTAGYVFNKTGFSAEAEHWSSLTEQDIGVNIISLKYRIDFK